MTTHMHAATLSSWRDPAARETVRRRVKTIK
jgi:hypothetical protein